MKAMIAALLAALAFCLPLAGCGGQAEEETSGESVYEDFATVEAYPQKAMDEIYAGIDIKEIEVVDDEKMEELGFDLWDISDYYARYSSGRYGLADVFIIKTFDEDYDTVRETLEGIKLQRVKATESYDVLGSHKIAQEAQIFQYGAYLIMLMLEDNEAALEIIQKYIPSTDMGPEPIEIA